MFVMSLEGLTGDERKAASVADPAPAPRSYFYPIHFCGAPMTYLIEGWIDDFRLEARAKTAKKAFAEAIEWHVAKQLSAVSIKDGSRSYSIEEFALAMAQQEIADTI